MHLKTSKYLNIGLPLIKKVLPDVDHMRLVKKNGVFAGSAFLVFNTLEGAQEAAAKETIEIAGKASTLKLAVVNERRMDDRNDRSVKLTNCPLSMREGDVKKAFPTVDRVKFVERGGKFCGVAFARFQTLDEANAALAKSTVYIGKDLVTVESAASKFE